MNLFTIICILYLICHIHQLKTSFFEHLLVIRHIKNKPTHLKLTEISLCIKIIHKMDKKLGFTMHILEQDKKYA